MLLNLVGIAAVVYLAVMALTYLSQASLLYLPEIPGREVERTPAALQMPFEDVRLQTADDESLHGWFVPASKAADNGPRTTVLIFHGNAGNISHRLETLRIWHALGYDSFIFDYRGYGNSTGNPSETGTHIDAETAWHYLVETRGIPENRIVLFGRSLGGAIASRLAAEFGKVPGKKPGRKKEPAALIIESGFTSVPDIAAEHYSLLPVRLLSRFEYDTRAYVQHVKCPVLVVHSRDDEIIPFHHAQKIHEAAASSRMLVISGGHNEGFLLSGNYLPGLRDFLVNLPE